MSSDIAILLPTHIRFPIGGDRVTCHVSKLTNSLEKQHLNFRLARGLARDFGEQNSVSLGASIENPIRDCETRLVPGFLSLLKLLMLVSHTFKILSSEK